MSKSRDSKNAYIDFMKLVELELERNEFSRRQKIVRNNIGVAETSAHLKELQAEFDYLEKCLKVNKDEKTSLLKEINKKRGNSRNKKEEKNQIQVIRTFREELLSTFEACDRLKIDAPDYITQADLIKIYHAYHGVFSALSCQPVFMQRLLGYSNGQQSKEAKENWDAFYAQIKSIEQINIIPEFFLNLDAYNMQSGLPVAIQRLSAKLQQVQADNQQQKNALIKLTNNFSDCFIQHSKYNAEFGILTENYQQLSNLTTLTQEQESELNSIQLSLDVLTTQIPQNRKTLNQVREELTLFLDKSLKELDMLPASPRKASNQAAICTRELKLLMGEVATQLSKQKQQQEFENLYVEFMQHIANISNQVDTVENKSKAEALAPAVLQQLTKLCFNGRRLPSCVSQDDLIKISHLPETFAEFYANPIVQTRLQNGDGSEKATTCWNSFYKALEEGAQSGNAKNEKRILSYIKNKSIPMFINKISKIERELEKLSSSAKTPDDKLDETTKKIKHAILNFRKDLLTRKPSAWVDSKRELTGAYNILLVSKSDFENSLMKQKNAPSGPHKQSFFAPVSAQHKETIKQLYNLKNALKILLSGIEFHLQPEKPLNQSQIWRRKVDPDSLPEIMSRRIGLTT